MDICNQWQYTNIFFCKKKWNVLFGSRLWPTKWNISKCSDWIHTGGRSSCVYLSRHVEIPIIEAIFYVPSFPHELTNAFVIAYWPSCCCELLALLLLNFGLAVELLALLLLNFGLADELLALLPWSYWSCCCWVAEPVAVELLALPLLSFQPCCCSVTVLAALELVALLQLS